MDNPKGTNRIELKLIKIQDTGFFMDTEVLNAIDSFNADNLNIDFGFKVNFIKNDEELILHLLVRYQYNNEGNLVKLLELSTANTFKIKNMEYFFPISDKEFNDNMGVLPNLVSVAVGTARGILYTKTIGTKLADFPLPIVNPFELCNNIKKQK